MQRNKTVDGYIESSVQWQDELANLRKILNACRLDETVKWGAPCYTWEGKNIVGIGAFKSYFGLWFFQGALLRDPDGVLVNAQAEKTKAMRQWRFQSINDIKVASINAYIKEAIELARSGKQIKPDRNKPILVPPELKSRLAQNKKTEAAFKALSKGRQREYADYIAEARRPDTKTKRLTKILPMIATGKGLHDKYR
ncbi:MAG: DUF1801 domain-containing protein [Gammaproteobacteria bacterium]|nr:DUF1801 domain-containing protein [Gammaproteobacteria bacterium]